MEKDKIKWHPAFAAAIQLELKEYKDALEFSVEHELTVEPLKIDVVIIKKLKDIKIDITIGKILEKYNIFEYKSPKDYISIDDYYKVKAYAYLYKVLSGRTNSIDIKDITITLTSARTPRKLIDYLKSNDILVSEKEPGLYYFEGTEIKTQLIVTKYLSTDSANYLKLLQTEHESEDIITKWLKDYIKNRKNPLYEILMSVLLENNPNEIMEGYKAMGFAKLSEDNRAFLMDAIKELEIDKKIKEEGKLEGKAEGKLEAKLEDAKNFLKLGVSVDIIVKATGLSKKDVLGIKKELES